jgi:hypothetical protein
MLDGKEGDNVQGVDIDCRTILRIRDLDADDKRSVILLAYMAAKILVEQILEYAYFPPQSHKHYPKSLLQSRWDHRIVRWLNQMNPTL